MGVIYYALPLYHTNSLVCVCCVCAVAGGGTCSLWRVHDLDTMLLDDIINDTYIILVRRAIIIHTSSAMRCLVHLRSRYGAHFCPPVHWMRAGLNNWTSTVTVTMKSFIAACRHGRLCAVTHLSNIYMAKSSLMRLRDALPTRAATLFIITLRQVSRGEMPATNRISRRHP
jgi:hypothetical protein